MNKHNTLETVALLGALLASSAQANALDMVNVSLDTPRAPTVESIASRTGANPMSVSRLIGNSSQSTNSETKTLAFQANPPMISKSFDGGSFLNLLVGLLSMFAGGGSQGMNLASTNGIGISGLNLGASTSPGASVPSNSNSGGIYGMPGQSQTQAPQNQAPGSGTASPANGQSFFKNLPLPQGSWQVNNNGHFWDCRGSGCSRPHHGNDLKASAGTPVYAVADGTVSVKKLSTNRSGNPTGYHRYIVIQHKQTRASAAEAHYNTLYGHIEFVSGVSIGGQVRAGQQIGTVSGRYVSAPHLHFEVLIHDGSFKGKPLNPNAFARFHDPSKSVRSYGNSVYTRSEPRYGRGFA